MADDLSKDDISLLKDFFDIKLLFIGRSLHKFIEKNKKTPCSVLKILINEPKTKIDFAKTMILILVAFGFGFAANYESQEKILIFDILTTIAILSMLISFLIIIYWLMDFITVEDRKWTLISFMIVLKDTDDNKKKDLRLYLTKKEDRETS